MEMCYNEAIVMPSNYVVMNNEEMEYIDGGGNLSLQIRSNSFIIHALSAIGGALTVAKVGAVLAGLGIAIATAIELGTAGLGTAGLGTLYAGAFLIAWGGVIPIIAGAAVTYGIQSLKGKTFNICNVPLVPDFTLKI
jgi:hypothetical protein